MCIHAKKTKLNFTQVHTKTSEFDSLKRKHSQKRILSCHSDSKTSSISTSLQLTLLFFQGKSESGKKQPKTVQSLVKTQASKSARVYIAVFGIYDFLGNLQSTDHQCLRIESCCHHGIKAKQCGSHTS